MKFLRCNSCSNLFEVIQDSAIVPSCCSKPMELLTPNTNDQGTVEKHVPVCYRDGNTLSVNVGKVLHPSLENHYIKWIEVETNKGIYRRLLNSNDIPSITFELKNSEDVINIYAYCNIHGLWAMN